VTRASQAIQAGRRQKRVAKGAWPYRMKDLCDLTGLPRQAIHFYIHEGLVPEGKKTGRNMAYYGEAHVERIKVIRQLQHERFLPLKAIRAVLDERVDAFSPAQRRLFEDLKQRLPASLAHDDAARATVDARAVAARVGLTKKDLDEMAALGMFATSRSTRGKLLVAKDDAWMIELWGEVRAIGFTRELGFPASVLTIYEEAIAAMFTREIDLFTRSLAEVPADKLASMLDRALPLIGTFLARYHETKVKNFFAAL
jgi:DNA-binding transcriptional MerR regulator